MRYRSWVIPVLLLLLWTTAAITQTTKAPGPLRLARITPDGDDVPVGRQIVLEFNRAVVPVGRMERRPEDIPITITPPLACAWRWLNTTTLACQLGEKDALQLATRYTLTVRPGITTQDGATLPEAVTHTFRTQRPKITNSWFKTWKGPERPEVLVVFDQPVTRASVEQHLYLHTEHKQRVALSASAVEEYKERGWLVQPVADLPLHTSVEVRVEPGIVSMQGPEPGGEQRTVVTFDTFPALRFLGVACTTNAEESVIVYPGVPRAVQPRCNPMGAVSLLFSAPVLKDAIKDVLQITPNLAAGHPDDDPWEEVGSYSRLDEPHKKGTAYPLWLPSPLKAYATYRLVAVPQQIKDEFGRTLDEAIAMQFVTAHRPPNYVFNHEFSVLEHNVDTHVPLVVTNLESFHLTYDTLTTQGRQAQREHREALYAVEDIAYAYPLKMRDLIPATSGAIQGTLRTTPDIVEEPQWFFSQVTPFHVHVKLGHYNTLVWVTRFDTGLPVNGVQVQITKEPLGTFAEHPPVLAEAATNADGIAMLDGTHALDPELALVERWERDGEPVLFVRLRQGADMALVPLTYAFWVRVSGTNQRYLGESLQKRYGHLRAWGTTPQGVYRAGDTVDYKLYVRDQDNQRLVPAPRTGYTLKIIDPMDKVVHEVTDVQLSEFGAYHGTFTVPETGAVGWYRFALTATFTEETWEPLRVLISDFTPAPFRVSTDLNGTLFAPGAAVTVLTQAKLHAGGPYGAAQTRLTAAVHSQPLVPDDPQAAGFYFAVRDEAAAEDVPEWEVVHETEAVLDDKGALETTFTLPQARVFYGQLQVESAVQDDRSKSVAGRTTAQYFGRDRYVGIHQADWVLQAGTPAQLQALVVNEHGRVVDRTEITVTVAQLQTRAAQVKDAGNTYVTRYEHTWVDVATCTVVSALMPSACAFTPPGPGTYQLTATIMDTQGRTHSSRLRRWVTGAGEVLWEMPHGYGLPIFPEKTAYRIGETARYLVQNPFPGAQALITVERFGVQQSWRETFHDSTAMVEFPITPEHLPGFYLSVLVMSPRVDKPLDANQVDLGKPAFRMGYVQVPVRDPYKELRVDVRPGQEVYKPRQKATVDLQVRTRQGAIPSAPVELAVAVLDEAVFDLIAAGRDYFDPYKGFYTLDTLDMRNYSLLVQLVGRQKFEKKGANPGGGGGLDLNLRSVFKFVSYWNPSLTLDATGQAQITFDLPDNLTGWRVLAMAVTPEEQMGLGEGHFKANKPTEIRPALPNQVTAGDRFEASFTVMNRTDTPRTLEVALNATGPLQASDGVRQTLQAEPYKRYLVRLPLQTTAAGTITLQARAGDSQDQDGLEVPLPVRWSQKLAVAATYGTSTSDTVSEAIAFPPDIRSDVGHVSVVVSPTVIGSLEGAFAYMRDYPYLCWEQVLTKGVMASHYRTLKPYLPASLQWSESESLPQHTLDRAANYQAPNGGMTYFVPQEQYVSPALSAYTALAFNWLRSSGYTIPAPVESKLHDYLLIMLRQDVMPDFYSRGMSSTVRAMALAALAPHTRISRADVQRYQPHVREMSVFGQAHYLLALTRVADTAPIQHTVVTQIRAHGNDTGGKLVFSEALDSAYQRILESPMRTNCAILSALLAYEAAQKKTDQAHDAPFKLTQTITQTRKNRHRWENTQENMFCMQALIDFSRAYERTTPDLTLQAALDTAPMGSATFRAFTDTAVDFQRPIQASDLGHTATMTLSRQGQGRFYYATRLFYSPATLRTEPINAGIEVHREYSVERKGTWELLHSPMEIKTGELVKVDLYLSLPAARNFVVVDDPVPGGLEPVNRDLATTSTVDADKANVPYAGGAFWFRYNDWSEFGATQWSFYHRELRHHVARFYSEYLPAGRYHLSYVAQAIAPGEFTVLPGHAEEMYNPETFGQGVPATLRIMPAGQVAAQP